MPEFNYTARNDRGQQTQGVILADSRADAAVSLRQQGLIATAVTLSTQLVDSDTVLTEQAAKRVTRDEVVAFSNQLAVMLETGVPLNDAIKAYTEQSRGGALVRVAGVLSDRIAAGVTFSNAIAEYPRVFPPLMVSLVRASEASGSMGPMLERVATYLGKDQRTMRQIRGALMYPLIMLTMGGAVTTFLVAWVLPKFAKIYEGRDAALPKPTQILLGISDTVSSNISVLLGALFAIAAVAIMLRITAWGRRLVDGILLGAPVVGGIFRNFHLTRISRTLSTLLDSGVQLKDALQIVRGVSRSPRWDDLLVTMDHTIDAGKPVSDAVMEATLIPASFAQMISAGERTGNIGLAFDKVADVSEEQFEDAVTTGTQLLEPIMIIVMGAVIGSVAIALLLPIFTMSKVMSH